MSIPPGQYPQPYPQQQYPQPPNPYGYNPMGYYPQQQQADPSALLGPAKWAGLMLIILGSLGLLGGGCCGVMSALMSNPEFQRMMAEAQAKQGGPELGENMGLQLVIVTVILVVWGIAAIVLGAWSRTGRRGPIIAAMVLTILSVLYMTLNLVGTILLSAAAGPAAIFGAVFALVPLVLFVIVLALQIKALRNAGQIDRYNLQLQMWQQQQAYAYHQQQQQGQGQ
jgi:hypothetical protein